MFKVDLQKHVPFCLPSSFLVFSSISQRCVKNSLDTRAHESSNYHTPKVTSAPLIPSFCFTCVLSFLIGGATNESVECVFFSTFSTRITFSFLRKAKSLATWESKINIWPPSGLCFEACAIRLAVFLGGPTSSLSSSTVLKHFLFAWDFLRFFECLTLCLVAILPQNFAGNIDEIHHIFWGVGRKENRAPGDVGARDVDGWPDRMIPSWISRYPQVTK